MTGSLRLRIGQAYRRSALFRASHPRRLLVFGIGGPKTGTHSVAGLFAGRYRAEHQPRARATVQLALAVREGRIGTEELRAALRRRNRELWLEADISFLNIEFAGLLAEGHPEARFVLTVREPRSWLRSIINQDLSLRGTSQDAVWRSLADKTVGTGPYPAEEQVLKENALPPLERLLGNWKMPIERGRAEIDPSRLMVVRTREIGARVAEIEAFTGAEPGSLARENAHLFKAPKDYGILDRIDPAWVEERIEEYCGALARELFPVEAAPGA